MPMEKSPSKRSRAPVSLPSPSPKELLRLPGKKALDVILESPTPARLVQSLAEEDLFWLVQDIGPEDALPILSVASNDQWQYLLDLELWDRDRLDTNSLNRWLALLLKADPERFFMWGLRDKTELIELHLYRSIEVRIKEEDQSASDFDDRYFTLDGVFYIRIREEKHEQSVRELLEGLAAHDTNRFHELLLALAGVLPTEVEEGIYRLRNVRLAEKGFLPFEEAIGIYQHLDPRSLLENGRGVRKVLKKPDPSQPTSLSTSLLIQDQDLFYLSLKHIDDGVSMERLHTEFAGMCNQIISADGFGVRDREALASVVRKACGYLDIGLQKLDGNDPARGARVVGKYPLHQIFRVGYGAGLELKWKAEKWLKKSWFVTQALGLAFWGDPWEGVLEGFLKKRPLFYTNLSDGNLYREFKDLSDIEYCREALSRMAAVDRLLSLVLAHTPIAGRMGYQPVRWTNLLLTSWARDHLGLSQHVEPIAVESLKAFFRDLWEKGEKPCRVGANMKRSFGDWLMVRTGLAADALQDQVGSTMDNLFKELENEYGSVSIQDLDPRYVRHFLVAS
jgi:hypothetical protein